MSERKHAYPSNYSPGTHWAPDEAWQILDALPVGALPDDLRFITAGRIAGVLMRIAAARMRRSELQQAAAAAQRAALETSDVVLMPPNTFKIEKLWVYVSQDAQGNEGACAGPIGPGGMLAPLIAADQTRLQSLTPLAESIANATGMKIVLAEFAMRTDLREITGASS